MNNRIPIIVILGTTGSGKSKLGIEIARKFGGEVISADSMQVYKGLDIITNKVTCEEKSLAPHHFLDIVEPLQRFTVLDFRNKALPIIEQLLKDGKIPVVVGGTNYYIESLLWKVLVENKPENVNADTGKNIPFVESFYSKDLSSCDEACLSPSLQFKNEGDDAKEKSDRSALECDVYQKGKISENKTSKSYDDVVKEVDDLVYEKDRKRLNASQCGDVESKRIRLEDKEVDIMDEAVLEEIPSQILYEKLKSVDPDMANQLHPNNKRKIIRSLQVFAQMGRKHSDILQEQRSAEGGSELGGPLRYPHSCILWLQCDQKVLDKRLDSRVDTMLEQGLLDELLNFHKQYNKERFSTKTEADYTKGIFQSIGFKEFHEYLVLNPEDRESEKGKILFQTGVQELKLVTRRYARRQIRWITNRFLRRPTRQVPPVYSLDATDPTRWNESVLDPATLIVESFLNGQKPSEIKSLPIVERSEKNEMRSFHCDVCDRIFVGDIQWNDHLKSKKHRKALKRKNMLPKSEQVDDSK